MNVAQKVNPTLLGLMQLDIKQSPHYDRVVESGCLINTLICRCLIKRSLFKIPLAYEPITCFSTSNQGHVLARCCYSLVLPGSLLAH